MLPALISATQQEPEIKPASYVSLASGFILLCALACPYSLVSPTKVLAAEDDASSSREAHQEGTLSKGMNAVIEDVKALATAPLRMDRQDALLLGGAVAAVGGMFAADRGIRTIVRHNTTSSGLDAADGFSRLGSAGGLLGLNATVIAIGALREHYGGTSHLKNTGLVSLEAQAFAVAATVLLKQVTGRARPQTEQGTTSFRPIAGGGGATAIGSPALEEITSPTRQKSAGEFRPFDRAGAFPSTHAAASFAVAAVFADRFDAPVGWLAYGLAAAVAGSRLYLDQHFASDVVAGAFIGRGLGKFLSRRHAVDTSEWHLEPRVMDSGTGVGLAVGKQF